MQEQVTDRLSSLVAWLFVAVPAAAVLLLAAWITTYKVGITGGVTYAVALAIWAALLLWRWKRT